MELHELKHEKARAYKKGSIYYTHEIQTYNWLYETQENRSQYILSRYCQQI